MIAIVKLKMFFTTLVDTRMRIPLLCLFLAAGNFYYFPTPQHAGDIDIKAILAFVLR
jgi:hypothetical protein